MGDLQIDQTGVLTPCSACGKTNRLRYTTLGKTTRCGHCSTALPAPSSPVDVPSAAVFDALVRESPLPVVVDFWAPWCPPCRAVAPELEKVARKAAGEYLVVKVDTEAVPELGQRFNVRSIPTMAVFQGNREVARTTGARPAEAIDTFVRAAVHSHA